MQRIAFTATNADTLLDAAAREYVNHPRGARIEKRRLIVSSIYDWFEEDFVDGDGSVVEHLERYAGPDLAAKLANTKQVTGNEYDWALNEAENS